MAVKEIPVTIREYYSSMKTKTSKLRDELIEQCCTLRDKINILYNKIKDNIEVYKDSANINLEDYNEFTLNQYIDGEFLKVAKGIYINRSNNYKLVSDYYDLYQLALYQKNVYDLRNQITLYDKMLSLGLREYTKLLEVFYTQVHKNMILNGEGYSFAGDLGFICLNRCTIKRKRNLIDFAATKQREKELKEEGKRIYNKEEADWCLKNGIKYEAEDKRVYLKKEHFYEVPLLACKIPNGSKYRFEINDRRGRAIRGLKNGELIEMCNNNLDKICELPLDIKTKVTLCEQVDKILYTKYIRNENQKPLTFTKADWKGR